MKRGFLNSKNVKDKPLYDKHASASTGSSAVIAPPKHLPPSGAVASPKQLSEPGVGFDFVEGILALTQDPHAVVRIPSLALTKSKEPFTTCIIRVSSCYTITKTPGFYTPLPPQNLTNVVFTQNAPIMGVGLFAKHSFKTNEMIFSERPLLVFPPGLPFLSPLPKEEALKHHDSLFEEALQKGLRAMTKEDVDAFMSLSTCHPNLPQVHGIASTNAFGTDIEEENLLEGKFGYSAVGRFASRINHSCSPNVHMIFDIPTFSLQVVALRDIKADQQLFYCYRELYRSAKERRRQLLEAYGFVCQCKACVNATPESDKLREEMNDRIQKIMDNITVIYANLNTRSLDPLLKLEKEIVKEGLDFDQKYINLLYIILYAYKRLNNIPKQNEYYDKCKKVVVGEVEFVKS